MIGYSDSDKNFMMFVGGLAVLGVGAWVYGQTRQQIGTGGSTGSIAPIKIDARLTDDGIIVDAFDRKWAFGDYPGQGQWAGAVIADIDNYMPPGATLEVYRLGEQFRPATDALKAAREALGTQSTWVLKVRDASGITGF